MSGILQKFDIASDRRDMLEIALSLTFFWNKGGASHYKIESTDGIAQLTLYSYETDGAFPLPFRLDTAERMASYVFWWLEEAQYGRGSGAGGSEFKGWRVFRKDYFSICTIKPQWIVYGK